MDSKLPAQCPPSTYQAYEQDEDITHSISYIRDLQNQRGAGELGLFGPLFFPNAKKTKRYDVENRNQ